jgi:hypothetical protein
VGRTTIAFLVVSIRRPCSKRGVRGLGQGFVRKRRTEQLPPAARRFVDAIEQLAGVPISIVSVGADRSATIFRRESPHCAALDAVGMVHRSRQPVQMGGSAAIRAR